MTLFPADLNSHSSRVDLQDVDRERQKPSRTTVVLSRVDRYNHHRLFLAAYMLAIGLATIGMVFGASEDQKLLEFYGAGVIITIPLIAIGLFFFWLKIKLHIVPLMNRAIEDYRIKQTGPNFNAPFAGISWSKCRLIFTVITSWMDVGGAVALCVTQSVVLSWTVQRAYGNADSWGLMTYVRHSGTDQAMVALIALALVGGIATLSSMIHGSYLVTLLCGYFRVDRLNLPSFYPLEIYQTSLRDLKPVYLL